MDSDSEADSPIYYDMQAFIMNTNQESTDRAGARGGRGAERDPECRIVSLPSELLALLVLAIDRAADVQKLALTCSTLYRVSAIPGVRALWLLKRYGRTGAWRNGLAKHRRLMAGPRDDPVLPLPPTLDDETDELGEFDHPGWSLPAAGPVPTVSFALLALGLPPPRCLVQEFFAWFTNSRNGFRAWDRENGEAFPELAAAAAAAANNAQQQLLLQQLAAQAQQPPQAGANAQQPGVDAFPAIDPWDAETVVLENETDDDDIEDPVLGPLDPDTASSADGNEDDNDDEDEEDEDEDSDMSSTTTEEQQPTTEPQLTGTLPTTLSFLPMPPTPTPPPIPRPEDQALLQQLLDIATLIYGPKDMALMGRDEMVLERLVRLNAPENEEDAIGAFDMNQFENEEGGRRWLLRRKEAFRRVKSQVMRLIFTFGYAPYPLPFRPPRQRDPRSNQPSLHAFVLMGAMLVHSPRLLDHLLQTAGLEKSQIVPTLLANLLRDVPVHAMKIILSQSTVETLGFGLNKTNVTGIWDSFESPPQLRFVVEGMLLQDQQGDRVPGPTALRSWGLQHLADVWNSLQVPLLTGSPMAKKLLKDAMAKNPSLLGLVRGNLLEAQKREKDALDLKRQSFSRIIVGVWEEADWPAVLFSIYRPQFDLKPQPWSHGSVLDAFPMLPTIPDLTPARARTAVEAICSLMRQHRAHEQNQTPFVYSADTVEKLLRFADVAYAFLIQATETGFSTVEDAEKEAQTGTGSFMITPGAGVFACLARGAVERILAKNGLEDEKVFAEEIMRLQRLLDAAVEITLPEGSGTILDFWEIDDANRIINHAPLPDPHPHRELIALVSFMCRNASKEILRRDRQSRDMGFRMGLAGAQLVETEPPSPRLQELFSPLRETFDDEEEDGTPIWSRAIGAETRNSQRDGGKRTDILLGPGVEVRKITFYGRDTVQALGFYLSDHSYTRLGRRHLLQQPSDSFELSPGEQIIKVTGFVHALPIGVGRGHIGRIKFHTDKGRSSPWWGNTLGETEFVLEAPRTQKRRPSRESRRRSWEVETPTSSNDSLNPSESLERDSSPLPPRPLIGFSASYSTYAQASDLSNLRVAWGRVKSIDQEHRPLRRPPTPIRTAAAEAAAVAGWNIDQQVAQAIEGLALAVSVPEDDGIED